jgi:WD40 repeat protein
MHTVTLLLALSMSALMALVGDVPVRKPDKVLPLGDEWAAGPQMVFVDDAKMLVVRQKVLGVRCIDMQSGKSRKLDTSSIDKHGQLVITDEKLFAGRGLTYSAKMRKVILGTKNGDICLVDLADLTKRDFIKSHQSEITAVEVNQDANRLLTVDLEGMVKVTDILEGKLGKSIGFPQEGKCGFCDAHWLDNTRFMTHGWLVNERDDDRHFVKIWDLEKRQKVRDIRCSTNTGWVVCAPKQKRFVANNLNTVLVHDLETGKSVGELQGHDGFITSMAIANGYLVTGGADNDVRIWDMQTLKTKEILRGHKCAVTGIRVSQEGQVATIDSGAEIRIWSVGYLRLHH